MIATVLAVFAQCAFLAANLQSAPDGPSVVLLPVVNTAGEKWQELKDKQVVKGNQYLSEEFVKRGFRPVDSGIVNRLLTDSKIDFTDEEQQKRDVLFGIGEKAKADFVLLAVITATDQRLIHQILVNKREGWADVKLWLLNIPKHAIVLSAKVYRGQSGGGAFAGFDKGSERQVQAVANGLRDGLKDFFKSYPPAKVDKE